MDHILTYGIDNGYVNYTKNHKEIMMEKEIAEVNLSMLQKMMDEANKEYDWSTKDPERFEYWRGYRAALYEVLEAVKGEDDEQAN